MPAGTAQPSTPATFRSATLKASPTRYSRPARWSFSTLNGRCNASMPAFAAASFCSRPISPRESSSTSSSVFSTAVIAQKHQRSVCASSSREAGASLPCFFAK